MAERKRIKIVALRIVSMLLAISVLGCTSDKFGNVPLDKWSFKYRKKISRIVLNPEVYLSNPKEIILYNGYLIVYDPENTEWTFHVYDKRTGEKKNVFGRIGRGPGELAKPSGRKNQFIYSRNEIMAYDDSGKIIWFSLDDSLAYKKPNFKERKKCGDCTLYKTVQMKNKYYLSLAPRESMSDRRFILYDSLLKATSHHVPFLTFDENSEYEEHERIRSTTFSRLIVKPDLTKIILGTHIGTCLEIFDVNQLPDTVITVSRANIELGKIKNLSIPLLKTVIPMPDRNGLIGFKDIYADDKMIYTIHSNRTWDNLYNGTDTLKIFNWNGEPKQLYSTDINMFCIAAEGKTIYAVSSDDDRKIQIVKFSM